MMDGVSGGVAEEGEGREVCATFRRHLKGHQRDRAEGEHPGRLEREAIGSPPLPADHPPQQDNGGDDEQDNRRADRRGGAINSATGNPASSTTHEARRCPSTAVLG